MSGIELSFGTHIVDLALGALVTAAYELFPKQQVKAGDAHMDHILDLTDKYGRVLRQSTIDAIGDQYQRARHIKDKYEQAKDLHESIRASREYSKQAKLACAITKKRCNDSRARDKFTHAITERAMQHIEERDAESRIPGAVKEQLRVHIHKTATQLYANGNPSYSSAVNLAGIVEQAWAAIGANRDKTSPQK